MMLCSKAGVLAVTRSAFTPARKRALFPASRELTPALTRGSQRRLLPLYLAGSQSGRAMPS
jgi:hypothetical protein